MTDKFWTIRFHPYSKKSHRKARWKKAEKRWFKRDPKRVADLEEVIRWAEETVGEAFNDGKICDWFEQGISSCFLNGSRCDCPFSKRGCEIQHERIFKKEPEGEGANRYKSDKELNPNKPLTRSDVFKRLKIKEGEHIVEWFIPYSQIDAMMVAPSDQIKYGVEMVQKKFDDSEFYLRFLRIYHNVKIGNQVGIYIIGTD